MTGVNKRVRDALEDSDGAALSIGEVMARADIDKRLAGDVSSALYKLLASGVVLSEIGPSSSNLGRRFVKRYRWVGKVVVVKTMEARPVVAASPFAGLGIGRIG